MKLMLRMTLFIQMAVLLSPEVISALKAVTTEFTRIILLIYPQAISLLIRAMRVLKQPIYIFPADTLKLIQVTTE